jgi:RNA-binding protein 26
MFVIFLFQTAQANLTSTTAVSDASVSKKSTPVSVSITKKEAVKKAAIEIHRKKQGLLDEQIQQQKLLLKKLESAETNAEKESIRALMKQFDATIVMLKDSLRLPSNVKSSNAAVVMASTSVKSPVITKLSQQDALKQRAQTLRKQIENLRAKTSTDMVC